MHVLAIALTAGLVHVAIVRLRLPLAVSVVAALVGPIVVSAFVPPTTIWASVAGGALLVVAFASAAARRQLDRVVEGIAAARPDGVVVRADGRELLRQLEVEGCQVAGDGWRRAERLDWSLVALRRGPSRVLLVSGERGPVIDVTTTFDNGRTLVTAASGRDRVAGDVVRQVIPTDDPLELLTCHDRAVAAAGAAGRTPVVRALDRLTADALADEVAHGRHLLAGGVSTALASLWREVSRTHADVGPVTERPAEWARLVAGPEG